MIETVTITGVASELQGVGRAADGRTLFVHGALPGERVEARITRSGKRFCTAETLRIIDKSEHRIEPACPHYGQCGGCAAQHMTYDYSLALKRQRVQDALGRIGGLPDAEVRETIASPEPWRYRNKAEYHLAMQQGVMQLGMRARDSHRLIEVQDCPLQSEQSSRFLQAVRPFATEQLQHIVTRVNGDNQLMGILCTRGRLANENQITHALMAQLPQLVSLYRCDLAPKPNHALDGRCTLLAGDTHLSEQLHELRFSLSPQSFFQVNRTQAEALIDQMLLAADLRGHETVLDVYCGIGTLTLPLAQRAARVIGLEIVPPAIEDARKAAMENGIDNAEFHLGDASAALAPLLRSHLKPDVVVVDPPRKGLDPSLIQQILTLNPDRIVYVSCDPGTLARDIKLLAPAYHLQYAQPLDMFPWTEHVETVALMSRVEK